MWQICFREYDSTGMLLMLFSKKAEKIRHRNRSIDTFLSQCQSESIREVQFYRNGKQYPSIITDGQTRKFSKPIAARLPIFDYLRKISEEA